MFRYYIRLYEHVLNKYNIIYCQQYVSIIYNIYNRLIIESDNCYEAL